ncbi:MAG: ROK family protein [Herminiimonas sp.]|uniref:ROK family protein n=1 Tax=Herminiimonas sp. TaxID=1926289 RepID=UPI00271582FB|nr:ROK family protein [Herminiimonas sp.]MDO9422436.1 ROK family protein [Herminiimonas sp.]
MHVAYIGGLDIGGTKIAATIADSTGPLVRVQAPTVKSGNNRAPAEQCVSLLKEACAKIGVAFDRLNTVGVSSCGPFIKEHGLISLVPPNICGGLTHDSDLPNNWTSVPLEEVLRENFPIVEIRNDCVAALAAERAFGNVQEETDCAYVTWSTGIGFGLCVDGNLLCGKNGNAGHAGHMLLSEQSDAQCGCGNFGDVEALISGRNLEAQFGRTSTELFNAAKAGEAKAQNIVAEAAKWFGRALFNVTTTLDLKVFLIGGSVWQHHGGWLEPLVMKELCSRMPALTTGVRLSRPALDAYVADIGALYLVMPDEWTEDWRQRQPWQGLPTL